MSNDSFLGRFKIALLRSGLKQLDIAVMSGLSEQYLSKIIHGDPDYDNRYVPIIAAALGVDPIWLGTGQGTSELSVPASHSGIPALTNANNTPNDDRSSSVDTVSTDNIILPTISPRVSMSATASGNNDSHSPPTIIHRQWRTLIISNDSGMPMVNPGHKVLVDPRIKACRDHMVAIILYGEFFIKKITGMENGKVLFSPLGITGNTLAMDLRDLARSPLVIIGTLWETKNNERDSL